MEDEDTLYVVVKPNLSGISVLTVDELITEFGRRQPGQLYLYGRSIAEDIWNDENKYHWKN
jgi:hypothetical protein